MLPSLPHPLKDSQNPVRNSRSGCEPVYRFPFTLFFSHNRPLKYKIIKKTRPQWESNPRPSDPKSDALIHCAMRSTYWHFCILLFHYNFCYILTRSLIYKGNRKLIYKSILISKKNKRWLLIINIKRKKKQRKRLQVYDDFKKKWIDKNRNYIMNKFCLIYIYIYNVVFHRSLRTFKNITILYIYWSY